MPTLTQVPATTAHPLTVELSKGWTIDGGNFTIKLAQQGNSWRWLLTGKSGCSSFMTTTNLYKKGVIWGKVSEGICDMQHITFFELANGPPPVAFAATSLPYMVNFVADKLSYGASFGDKFVGTFDGNWQYSIS
jgi:hypothetical protein